MLHIGVLLFHLQVNVVSVEVKWLGRGGRSESRCELGSVSGPPALSFISWKVSIVYPKYFLFHLHGIGK